MGKDVSRGEFIRMALAASAGLCGPAAFAAKPEDIRAVLLHMGMNMWGDWRAPGEEICEGVRYTRDHVFFDEGVWRKTIDHAKSRGVNMVLMDIGEFVKYPSHPELAVKGSWEPERLNAEVRRLRTLGLEPIPKLNFASPHDSWLKEYHRMLGTGVYYKTVEEVIRDLCEIFEHPRLFHIGWDEEVWDYQKKFPFAVVRQRAVWWHDFLWLGDVLRKQGARPWTFVGEWIGDSYLKKCPKDVLQTNYCYDGKGLGFDLEAVRKHPDAKKSKSLRQLELTVKLDEAGFDQVPLLSNWLSNGRKRLGFKDADDLPVKFAAFNRRHVASERLKGFLMASWTDCQGEENMRFNMRGIDLLADACA